MTRHVQKHMASFIAAPNAQLLQHHCALHWSVSCSAALQATFTARSFSAVEGNGTATVSVQLLGRTAVPVTVRVTPFGLNTTTAATGQTHTHTHTTIVE